MGHHYEMPIVSFLAVILLLLPLPWHWKARNVATLSLIAWLAVCNIIRGVNSIIWMDNVKIHYHVWCDISTKVFIGVGVALPACSLCITRHLEHVSSVRSAITTAADKKRRRYIDLCFTIGIPVVIMALHYIVQGHRFDIVEDFGCQPVIYTSIAGLLIIFGTPIVLSVISLVFAALALRHFAVRRLQFAQHLRDSKSALTTGRYMRLMGLALTEMLWGTSLGSFIIFENIRQLGLRPWISWSNVHYNFSRVAVWPTFLIRGKTEAYLSWWVIPSTAILFFLFFGLSDEAREGYVSMGRWVRRRVFKLDDSAFDGTSKGTSLPQFRSDMPMPSARSNMPTCPDDMDDFDLPDLKNDTNTCAPSYEGKDTIKEGRRSSMSLTMPALPDIEMDLAQGNAESHDEYDSSPVRRRKSVPAVDFDAIELADVSSLAHETRKST